jgi:hypothetical protein
MTDYNSATDVDSSEARRPGALETIVLGGLAIEVLDFLDATLFVGLYVGVPFERVWQGVIVVSNILPKMRTRQSGPYGLRV